MAGRGTDILLGGNPEYLAKQALVKEGVTDDLIELATSYVQDVSDEVKAVREKYNELYEDFKKETDKEKEEVIALGGLFILGTERHESRRIDNQLRGRSGRQGDPGARCSSFLSRTTSRNASAEKDLKRYIIRLRSKRIRRFSPKCFHVP